MAVSDRVSVVRVPDSGSTSSAPPDLGDGPNQPTSFKFPKRKFGQKNPVFRCVQSAWFQKWPWLHYDQVEDKMFATPVFKLASRGT